MYLDTLANTDAISVRLRRSIMNVLLGNVSYYTKRISDWFIVKYPNRMNINFSRILCTREEGTVRWTHWNDVRARIVDSLTNVCLWSVSVLENQYWGNILSVLCIYESPRMWFLFIIKTNFLRAMFYNVRRFTLDKHSCQWPQTFNW